MAVTSIWFGVAYVDTSGNSGNYGMSYTIAIKPTTNTTLATATLSQVFINSSGGSASAVVDSFEIQPPGGPSGFKLIPVNSPALWDGIVSWNEVYEAPRTAWTFRVFAYAQPAGFGFSNGSNAYGMFKLYGWDS
jgi:hypothetical protein